MSNDSADKTIDVSPTKEFFIDTLVKDVQLTHAIAELVDNSVDGAKKVLQSAGTTSESFKGFKVAVTFDTNEFKIKDNCGGISVEVARKYAFKFGRIANTPKIRRGIGQFGVGMKRALFKLGRLFEVKSISPDSSFLLKVNVEEWKQGTNAKNGDPDTWEFNFATASENEENQIKNCGTAITVKNLNSNVKREFGLATFNTRLITLIQDQQAENLANGLAVSINGYRLEKTEYKLLSSEKLKPMFSTKTHFLDSNGKKGKIVVKIYAGIGEDSRLKEAGWYIFCNGRMILKADKTADTGWGQREAERNMAVGSQIESSTKTPSPHPQFAYFRGFVYFESDEVGMLPWNTSKSGIDLESPVYQATRLEMTNALRQVIDFLNKVKEEKDRQEDYLQHFIRISEPVRISEIKTRSAKFVSPKPKPSADSPQTTRIRYEKPKEEFDKVKKLLRARSAKEVGEKTFDFYLEKQEVLS